MSPRSIRRAAERKQRKLLKKQERLTAAAPAPDPLEDEFSPELIAEARAMRQRIEARAQEAAVLSQPKTRREINRANAAHSSGPVTPQGKLASSRNSLKHGLASGQLILPGEDETAFEALLANLMNDFQPANSTEELLVRQMAQSHWLEQRALRLQNDCFTPAGLDEKRLALFLRYQTTHQRAFYKALHELTRMQKDRVRAEVKAAAQPRGFVSQNLPTTVAEAGFVSQNLPTTVAEAGFVSHNPPTTVAEAGFVSQNRPVPHLAGPPHTAEAA